MHDMNRGKTHTHTHTQSTPHLRSSNRHGRTQRSQHEALQSPSIQRTAASQMGKIQIANSKTEKKENHSTNLKLEFRTPRKLPAPVFNQDEASRRESRARELQNDSEGLKTKETRRGG